MSIWHRSKSPRLWDKSKITHYHILVVIRAVLNNVRSEENRGGGRYRPDVISHSVILDLKMRDGLQRGMCYKLEVHISPREYSSLS